MKCFKAAGKRIDTFPAYGFDFFSSEGKQIGGFFFIHAFSSICRKTGQSMQAVVMHRARCLRYGLSYKIKRNLLTYLQICVKVKLNRVQGNRILNRFCGGTKRRKPMQRSGAAGKRACIIRNCISSLAWAF
jgi:hypothetical protein